LCDGLPILERNQLQTMQLNKIDDQHNIYEFSLSGDLEDEEIQNLKLAFEEFKRNKEKIKLLGHIKEMPDLEAMKNVGELSSMKIAAYEVIDRYAILTDKEWLEEVIPMANFLTPRMQLMTFESKDLEQAMEWLKEEEYFKEYDPEEYLSGVEIRKTGDFNYEIDMAGSEVDYASMVALNQILKDLHKGEKINLMVILKNFPTIDSFKAVMEGLKVDLRAIGRLKKYAIVSDLKWIEAYSKIGDFLTPGLKVKSFHMDEIKDARTWLNQA